MKLLNNWCQGCHVSPLPGYALTRDLQIRADFSPTSKVKPFCASPNHHHAVSNMALLHGSWRLLVPGFLTPRFLPRARGLDRTASSPPAMATSSSGC